MNYQQIEKEFEPFFDEMWESFLEMYDKAIKGKAPNPEVLHPKNSAIKERIKSFYKAKINQVIDKMIGKEKKNVEKYPMYKVFKDKIKRLNGYDIGYNKKVQELKEYKKKFNKK